LAFILAFSGMGVMKKISLKIEKKKQLLKHSSACISKIAENI